LALYLGQAALGGLLGSHGWRYLGLGLLILLGTIVYFGFGTAIGAFRITDFRRNLRRQR
jgi:putative peptidoglycan lipid II flippase